MEQIDTGWPWPLDAVQQWFEGLLNTIWSAPYWAIKQVWDFLPDWVKNAVGFISNLGYYAGSAVWEFFRNPVGAIASGLTWVVDQIKPLFAPISQAIEALVGLVYDKLKPIIDPIFATVDAWKKYYTDAFYAFVKDPGGFVKSRLDALGGDVKTYFDGAFSGAGDVIGKAISGVAKAFEPVLIAAITYLFGGLNVQIKTSSPQYALYYDPQASTRNPFAGIVYEGVRGAYEWLMKSLKWAAEMIVGIINAVVSSVQAGVNSLFTGLVHSITGAFTTGSPDPQLAGAVNVMVEANWTRQMEIISKMYKSPPTAEDITLASEEVVAALILASFTAMVGGAAIDIAHPFKEVMASRTVREIMWMVGVPAVTASIITLPTAIGLLTPLRYALNEQWQPMQPPAADIIRFAVRECFIAERLPALLERYPGEAYTKAMAREGYSGDWAKFYWGAHWVLPAIESLNAYLYRHDDFKETWRKYIVYHDYIPESVKWLEEVIYPPWTRVDIRRMWDVRTVTEADLYREYRWGGYDDVHAKGLVLWTKVYTELPRLRARYRGGWITAAELQTELVTLGMPSERAKLLVETVTKADVVDRMKGERDLTKSEILRLYRIRQITRPEAFGMLKDMGYDDMEVDYLLSIEDYKVNQEIRELTTSQVLSAYRLGIYTRLEASKELTDAGLSADAVETLLKIEDVKLAEQKGKEERKPERDLTKSDILALYRIGQLVTSQAKDLLIGIGYDATEADYLLAVTEAKMETELRELTSAQILKAYRYQILDRDGAKSRLIEAGYSENAAQILLNLEDIALEDAKTDRMRERDLTPAQIIRAVKAGVINLPTGVSYLAYLGYSEWEITVILKLEGLA